MSLHRFLVVVVAAKTAGLNLTRMIRVTVKLELWNISAPKGYYQYVRFPCELFFPGPTVYPLSPPTLTHNVFYFQTDFMPNVVLIWNDFEWSLVTARLLRLKRIWVIREMDEYLLSVSKSATAEPVYSETASAAKGYWHLRQLHSTPNAVSGSDHTGNYIKSFDALIPMKETPPHAR